MSEYRKLFGLGAVLALAATVAATGCSSSGGTENTEPDPGLLVGNTYVSGQVTGPAIPGGGPLEISFPQPGRIAAMFFAVRVSFSSFMF